MTKQPYSGVGVSLKAFAFVCRFWSDNVTALLSKSPLVSLSVCQVLLPYHEVFVASHSRRVNCKTLPGVGIVSVEGHYVTMHRFLYCRWRFLGMCMENMA